MLANKITIHCSATKNGDPVDIEAIRKYHKEVNGWTDIGYHLVIDVNGSVGKGRPLNEVAAHVGGHNTDNIGICLVGTDRFSEAQFAALRVELDSLLKSFTIPKWAIYCHNQFDTAIKQGKTCPGMEINRLLTWYHLRDETAISPYKL
jgi:N-acetylmuramoyl-L-alanine amidase